MSQFDPRACVASALHAHSSALRRYVASRVAPDDVEDVLQIAALRAIEKAEDLKDPARVKPWLYRIHSNIVIDIGRKKAAEQRLIEAFALEAEPRAAEPEPVCGCSIALARQLNANYATILNLVDVAGVPIARVASALRISVNNATVRLHRARRALKKRLLDHCGVTSRSACYSCGCVSAECSGG
ncbi:MAG: sigma-70 family RNA polymerase sigma factor [Pseudomonadota bacterium]